MSGPGEDHAFAALAADAQANLQHLDDSEAAGMTEHRFGNSMLGHMTKVTNDLGIGIDHLPLSKSLG